MIGHLCDLAYSHIALVMRSRTEGTYFIGITVNIRGPSGRKWEVGVWTLKQVGDGRLEPLSLPMKDDLNRPSQ